MAFKDTKASLHAQLGGIDNERYRNSVVEIMSQSILAKSESSSVICDTISNSHESASAKLSGEEILDNIENISRYLISIGEKVSDKSLIKICELTEHYDSIDVEAIYSNLSKMAKNAAKFATIDIDEVVDRAYDLLIKYKMAGGPGVSQAFAEEPFLGTHGENMAIRMSNKAVVDTVLRYADDSGIFRSNRASYVAAGLAHAALKARPKEHGQTESQVSQIFYSMSRKVGTLEVRNILRDIDTVYIRDIFMGMMNEWLDKRAVGPVLTYARAAAKHLSTQEASLSIVTIEEFFRLGRK